MENLSDFDFYLKFTKPLILSLPEINERILAAAWVKKLAKDSKTSEKVRLDHLKLLLFILQRKKLTPPFTQHPNSVETLEEFPENQTLVDVAKKIIEKENEERREKNLKRMKGQGDFPPYISDFSADLLEYVAVQTIDDFGVHAYYAMSKTPLSLWYRVDKKLFPKAAKSMVDFSSKPPSYASQELVEPHPEGQPPSVEPPPEGQPPSVEEPPLEVKTEPEPPAPPKEETPKKKSPRKPTFGSSPPSRPIGKIPPQLEDWEPPTWGSNLLEAKFLDEDIDDIAKQIEDIDDFFQDEIGDFSPVKASTQIGPADFPAEVLWSSPPHFALGDESPLMMSAGELPSFDESLSLGEPSEVSYTTVPMTPSSVKKQTPQTVRPPPKKVVPKIKPTRASLLLQKKKEAEQAPPPPPKKPKVIKKPSKGKTAKKKPSKEKVPAAPEEPFLDDEVEQYLTEFNTTMGEIEEEYRKGLEDYRKTHPQQEEPPPGEVSVREETKPKRQISRLARLTKPKIPKSHAAAVELEKSIHVSPEARDILEGIVEGPSTSKGLTKYPKSRLRAPKPRLQHPPKKEEEKVEAIEETPIEEEEDFANMESVHGHSGKDARIVSKINEMIQEVSERHKDSDEGYKSILEDLREEDRRRLQAIKARYFPERTPPRQPSEELEQMEEYYRPQTPEEEKKAIREFKAETYDRTKEVRPEKTFKIRQKTIETTPSGHVLEEYREEDRRRLQAIKARYFPERTPPRQPSEELEQMEEYYRPQTPEEEKKAIREFKAETYDRTKEVRPEKTFKIRRETIETTPSGHVVPAGASPEYSPEVQELLDATILEVEEVSDEDLQIDMAAEQADIDQLAAMEKQFEDEYDEYMKFIDEQLAEDAPEVISPRGRSPEATDMVAEPIGADDFEAMERQIEEEMRRAGEDPHAKPKRKQTRKEYEESRKRFLDVHRVTDAQMEELEAAADFVEPIDLDDLAELEMEPRLVAPPRSPRKRKYKPPPPVRRGRKPLSPLAEQDEEEWIPGPEFFTHIEKRDRERRDVRAKPPQFVFPGIDFPEDEDLDAEILPEEFFEIDEDLDMTSPSKTKKQTDDIQLLYKDYYKSLPAYTGVPLTTPRRTAIPGRSPEGRGGPMADLIEVAELSPTTEVDKLVKKYRPRPWLPESPPVSELERRPLPTLEDIEAKYSPRHFQVELESPGIQYEQMKGVPAVDMGEISPRRKDWYSEVEGIHNWLWGTPVQTHPTVFDVPGGDRMYAESPPHILASPVSPMLSPPIRMESFKEEISRGAVGIDKKAYRRRVGPSTIVERRSRPPTWARTIPEAKRETPAYFTDEDIELVEALEKHQPIKGRRRFPFPLRSMRFLGRHSPAPRLGEVPELYESPDKKHPDIFDLPPIDESVFEEAPPEELFPGMAMTKEDYEDRLRIIGAQPMPMKDFTRRTKRPDLSTFSSETTPPRRAAAPPLVERPGERRRMFRKKLKKRALDFSKEPSSADEERIEVIDVETEMIDDDLSTPPSRRRIQDEGLPTTPPSHWGVRSPRRQMMKMRKPPGLGRVIEDPIEERAAVIHHELEEELKAEMRAQEKAERARRTLLDEDVPEYLPPPVEPPPLVPGYQTPPHLKRRPKTPPQKTIRIMPSSFRDVLAQEAEPDLYESPPTYTSFGTSSRGSPRTPEGSPGLLPSSFYETSPQMFDGSPGILPLDFEAMDEGTFLQVGPALDVSPPPGIHFIADDVDGVKYKTPPQYPSPPLRAPSPPQRVATPPLEPQEFLPVDDLIRELAYMPRTTKPDAFDPREWYTSQISETMRARIEEEERARAAEAMAAQARGPEVVEFQYQETVKEHKPAKAVKPASKVVKALKGKGKVVPPEKKTLPGKKPERVPKKEIKPVVGRGGKPPVKTPSDRKLKSVNVKSQHSQQSLKKITSKLDTGRKKKKKEEVKKPEPVPVPIPEPEAPPPPLEFDFDIEALQELSVTAADLHGINLLDVEAEDMPDLVPADSPERPHDPHWPRRWARPSKRAGKLPALTETEEEHRTGPMGFDMRWDLSPASRVAMRAPDVKVLPEPLKDSRFQFEKVYLEPSPERAYYQPMPVARPEDISIRDLEREEMPEFIDDDEFFNVIDDDLKGDLRAEEYYDQETQTMTRKLSLDGKFVKSGKLGRYFSPLEVEEHVNVWDGEKGAPHPKIPSPKRPEQRQLPRRRLDFDRPQPVLPLSPPRRSPDRAQPFLPLAPPRRSPERPPLDVSVLTVEAGPEPTTPRRSKTKSPVSFARESPGVSSVPSNLLVGASVLEAVGPVSPLLESERLALSQVESPGFQWGGTSPVSGVQENYSWLSPKIFDFPGYQ